MTRRLDELADDSDIIDRAVTDCAHLVLSLYDSEQGRIILSRRVKRKIESRLETLSPEGMDRVYDYLREVGEDYLLLEEKRGKDILKAHVISREILWSNHSKLLMDTALDQQIITENHTQ